LSRALTAVFAAAMFAAPLAVSAQETAQAPTTGSQASPAASPANRLDPNRRVCKGIIATGSRLGKSKICKTAREWELQRQEQRQSLNRMQKLEDKQSGG
jgi:hypothetical protein